MYVFRRPLRRKMVTLTGQVGAMHLKQRIKIVCSILQELDKNDREEILTNWENHDTDDGFSFSETSNISSFEGMNTVSRQGPPQLPKQQPEQRQQQQQQKNISDCEDEEEKEE